MMNTTSMKIQLVMPESLGGQTAPIPAATARGNVIVFPSGSHVASTFPSIDHIADDPNIAPSSALDGGRGEELLRLENCWLDLTSDIASFMELGQIPEVVKEDEEKSSPPVSSPISSPSLILPNIVRAMALGDDIDDDTIATEMLMNANMKILDNFIMETSMNTDNSLDSFSSDLDSNQSLIDEVENYLLAASGGESTTIGLDEAPEIEFKEVLRGPAAKYIGVGRNQKQIEMSTTVENNNNTNSSFLKALMAGKVLATAGDEDGMNNDLSLDLTEEDLSNAYTTTIKTENGQDVIIIIAQPGGGGGVSPLLARRETPYSLSSPMMALGSPDYSSSASSDYEWSPSPARSQPAGQPQRKKYQRKNKPTLALEPYPR